MPSLRHLHPLTMLVYAAGLAAACVTIFLRHEVEEHNRAVELVVDYNQLRTLATTTGHPMSQALLDFRAAGIRGVAVTEGLLEDLPPLGRVRLDYAGNRIAGSGPGLVIVSEPGLFARIRTGLGRYLAQVPPARAASRGGLRFAGPGGESFEVPYARWEDLELVPIGLDPQEILSVRMAVLDPVARLYNFLGATPASIRSSLAGAQRQGARTVIFAEEEILGYQRRIADTAAGLRGSKLYYGSVEFGKQRGDEELSTRALGDLIRVHSISATEMARMSTREAMDRYARAVDERNIRICFVRLLGTVGVDTYRDNLRYVRELAAELTRGGFTLQRAHPLPEWRGNGARTRLLRAGTGAAVGAAAVMLLACCVRVGRRAQLLLTLALALGGAALLQQGVTAAKIVALAAALILPTLAFALLPQPLDRSAAAPEPRHPVGRALLEFLVMCGISLSGGILIGSALAERAFMLKVESFAGIKLAHVAPLLGVGTFYLLGLGSQRTLADLLKGVRERWNALLAEPLRTGQAVLLLCGVAVLALLVMRTGNEPGVGVSDLEMRFRSLLEDHLVRPRTKEFLIGHPALLLGLTAALIPGYRRLALPLLLVGAIGQASIVNSFCHLHTPVLTTLLRTVNGIWLGAAVGLTLTGLLAVARRALPGEAQPATAAPDALIPRPDGEPAAGG